MVSDDFGSGVHADSAQVVFGMRFLFDGSGLRCVKFVGKEEVEAG